jgi:Type IV secretion system pilin
MNCVYRKYGILYSNMNYVIEKIKVSKNNVRAGARWGAGLVFALCILFISQSFVAFGVLGPVSIHSVSGTNSQTTSDGVLYNIGVYGGLLYINGTGFSETPADNIVLFGTKEWPVEASGTGQIIVRIPTNEPIVSSRPLTVRVGQNTSNVQLVAIQAPVASPPQNPPVNPNTPPSTNPPAAVTCGKGVLGGLGCVKSQFDPKGSLASADNIGDLIIAIINVLLGLLFAVAVLFIIIGGYQFVTSAGKEDQAKSGKRTLTYAVIGMVIVILSYMIARVIDGTVR